VKCHACVTVIEEVIVCVCLRLESVIQPDSKRELRCIANKICYACVCYCASCPCNFISLAIHFTRPVRALLDRLVLLVYTNTTEPEILSILPRDAIQSVILPTTVLFVHDASTGCACCYAALHLRGHIAHCTSSVCLSGCLQINNQILQEA